MEDEPQYRVVSEADKYLVTDPSGRNIMTCGDARSAEHYATMLSKAFQQGYRSGYRAAKNESR